MQLPFRNTVVDLKQQILQETSLVQKLPCTHARYVVPHTINRAALAGRNMKTKWLRFASQEGHVVQGTTSCYYANCVVRLVLQLHI